MTILIDSKCTRDDTEFLEVEHVAVARQRPQLGVYELLEQVAMTSRFRHGRSEKRMIFLEL